MGISAINGHEAVVSALLAGGAEKDATTKAGATPMWVAAMKGHAEVVSALLAAGADKNVATPDGITAMIVAGVGHQAVAALLADGRDEDGTYLVIKQQRSRNDDRRKRG